MAPTTRRRSIPSHRRVPHRSPPPHPKRPPPHRHITHILRLPNELLTEIVILCSECRPTLAALIQTCNRLLDITAPHLYRSIRFSCGGTSPRTNDIRRATSLCSALLSDLEFGNHVKSLRLDNLRYVGQPFTMKMYTCDTTTCSLVASFWTRTPPTLAHRSRPPFVTSSRNAFRT